MRRLVDARSHGHPLAVAIVVVLGLAAYPAQAERPGEVQELIAARAFTLAEGFRTSWQLERPWITSGYVVVLRVTPSWVRPQASVNRVLFADSGTVEYLNRPGAAGIVVGLVPGPIDLTAARLWFGSRGAPAEIGVERIELEWAAAVAEGIEPFSAAAVQQALAAGGEALWVDNRKALLEAVGPWIEAHDGGGP